MEREPKHRIPKAARYPLFLVGLGTIIFGGLAGVYAKASPDVEAAVAGIGFVVLVLSVALR